MKELDVVQRGISLIRYFFLILLFPIFCLAEDTDLLEFEHEGRSKNGERTRATKAITQDAIDTVSAELISELIGTEKYAKNKIFIRNKIIQESGRYISYVKTSRPEFKDGEFIATVKLKISPNELRALLLKEGLLSDSQGPATMIPYISVEDRVNSYSYKWWQGDSDTNENNFLKTINKIFLSHLNKKFKESGFFIIDPIRWSYGSILPHPYRVSSFSTQDLSDLSKYFGASLSMKGKIEIRAGRPGQGNYRIHSKFTVSSFKTSRVIAEIDESQETQSGPFEQVLLTELEKHFTAVNQDLFEQVSSAWKKGTAASNLVRLVLKGKIDYSLINQFKKALLRKSRVVKSLTERKFSGDTIEFIADVSGRPEELKEILSGIKLDGGQVRVQASDSAKVEMVLTGI